jgi:peptidoglycan lytic transglycosylase
VVARDNHRPSRGRGRYSWPLRGLALGILFSLGGAAFAAPNSKAGGALKKSASSLARIAKPAAPSQLEIDHVKRLDSAIASLRNFPVSKEDRKRIKEAFKAIGADKGDKALALRSKIKNSAGRKLVDWYRLRQGQGELSEYREFLDANRSWPNRRRLTRKFEQALFTKGGSASEIRGYFKKGGPDTAAGFAALASAYLAEGKEGEARKLAQKVWRQHDLPAELEQGFLSRFKKFLTAADHKWRLDRLLISDVRWRRQKKKRAAIAKRVIPLLSAKEKRKARARLAVFLGSKKSRALIAKLPAESLPDWGVVFHRIQALRRSGKTDKAAKLMLGAPTEEAKTVVPDVWWKERQTLAYAILKRGKPKLAYEIVREAGPLTVNSANAQAFMAGWLALRYLKNAALAESHFAVMRKSADGPLTRSKANYWFGRAVEERSGFSVATVHYREAAREKDTFYGQLARQKLEPGRQPIIIKAPVAPTRDEIARFSKLDAAQAVIVARKSGLRPFVFRNFLVQLRYGAKSEGEAAMVAHLAEAVGDTQSAVRAGKTANSRGHNLLYYAYPVHPFPSYKPLRAPPETAFLLGIARQETEFNTLIVSGAGAKGLLQVMTVTAKHVCRDYKIKCRIKKLTTDPSYNAMIASAYVGDRMKEFSGSYVLTLAGYNAGPGRARQWIREFGDPRDPKVDPIDWIERIPFSETRLYVGKVLSNIQIYRARLGQDRSALRLEEDLNRASRGARRPGSTKTRTPKAATSDG